MHAHHIKFTKLLDGGVQYTVPRWQRRYCWGKVDIERLVADLLTIDSGGPNATHYGGTLLTFRESGAAGVVDRIRVVDGQQRLTTVSILLACIADELGPDGQVGDWTQQVIHNSLLRNPDAPPGKRLKLKLQRDDDKEYRLGLDGKPNGAGAVTQAWKTAKRLVKRSDEAALLRGLLRLRVVSIGLSHYDDPQQIFESLNATGRPLTESEKVKNWLLMGLPHREQIKLHDEHWLAIEKSLGAMHSTNPIDIFLRDLLRWKTGNVANVNRVYEDFRRWAFKTERASDRPALCVELAGLARLYGTITGTAGPHKDPEVAYQLRHLRALGIDVHRPLTLRLLHDASEYAKTKVTRDDLAATLLIIATWLTRQWLADRPTAGTNMGATELAHRSGPDPGEDYVDYWTNRIRAFRNNRAGVPTDEEVHEGIRNRKAYGGRVNHTTKAFLCALMEAEHGKESPPRASLTIEHIMPQELTDEWRQALGDDAEETHGKYLHRLANLTLTGFNPSMGASSFSTKKEWFKDSPIKMTRRLAKENVWDSNSLDRRADHLSSETLALWQWCDPGASAGSGGLRWRIGDGPWKSEETASHMVLNVVSTLLDRDEANTEKLLGDAVAPNIHPADRPPQHEGLTPIPGHTDYVMYPYAQDRRASADRCSNMGKRCGVTVEVAGVGEGWTPFWRFLKGHTGGVRGQPDSWRGASQQTSPINSNNDRIRLNIRGTIRLYIRARGKSPNVSMRMRRFSRAIVDQMADQELSEGMIDTSNRGRTISVRGHWTYDDKDSWPDVAEWIRDQHDRLLVIASDGDSVVW